MTSKPVLLAIVVPVLLFSCQQSENSDNNTPTETLINTSVFPIQPLRLDSPANFRLSYTGRTVTDSSVFYQVMATYKGETVGFNLSVPKGEEGTAYFSGTGKVSDNFLHFMQGMYGGPIDTTIHFGEDVSAHFLSLGALVNDSTMHLHDSAARVPDSTARSPESAGTQNKLVFRNATTGDSAELYLDINEKEHWIGLAEKDTLYRARLIRALARH
ncbi:MAG TPA: hypothetical protein VGN00_19825 [Puia sp.]